MAKTCGNCILYRECWIASSRVQISRIGLEINGVKCKSWKKEMKVDE